MTIHKAKGLGFPVVLVLLYEERSRGFDYIIEEDEEGACLLKITKDILNSAPDFEGLYSEEALKDKVNGLNSLYVGFTRPKEELYVIGVKGGNNGYPLDLLPADEYPPLCKPVRIPPEHTETPQSFSIRHSHKRTEYHGSTDELISTEERQRGEFIHKVLFSVEYAQEGYEEELLANIRRLNKASGSEYPEEEIQSTVIGLLEHEEMTDYFRQKTGRTIRREQEFSDAEGRLFRMDRVIMDKDRITVVDYKTGREKDTEGKYQGQMKAYMKILKGVYPQMEVEGIIAYVDLGEIRRLL
jgi:ATP-dependent exoDNAse (exonuclease V) beta subunit